MKYIAAGLCVLLFSLVKASAPTDSVGVSKIGNMLVIIHKVEKGEGLIAIAKRYRVSVDEIKNINAGLKAPTLGQKLKIPYIQQSNKILADSTKISVDDSHANADSKENTADKKHIVVQGETVAKIAGKYKVSTQQLIKWNNIKNNTVLPGQELRVSGYTVIKPYEKWNMPNSTSARIDSPRNTVSSNLKLIEEFGMPELSEKVAHPSLPVGTFVLCSNPETGRQFLVKVQQNRPMRDKIIMGIPQQAMDSLGLSDSYLPILIQYSAPQ
jgi:LysM repeat protein